MESNKSSATAAAVFAGLVLASRQLPGIVAAETIQEAEMFFSQRGLVAAIFIRLARTGWGQALLRTCANRAVPGIIYHYAYRKHYIEDELTRCVAAGSTQVVILGAGFDSLGQRLALRYPGVQVFDVDYPGTSRARAKLFQHSQFKPVANSLQPSSRVSTSHEIPDNLSLVDADLTHPRALDALTRHPRFAAGRSTVVVAEGVLMYFDRREIDQLIADLMKRVSGPLATLFTFMELNEKGRPCFHGESVLVRCWMSFCKEPFRWGMRVEDAEHFAKRVGYDSARVVTSRAMREANRWWPHRLPQASGEHLVVAQRSEF